MARKSRRKKAKASAHQTNTSAARLTLLGLPIEIRTMILRMVVGDQLIHVRKNDRLYYDSDGEWIAQEREREWTLARTMCIAEEKASRNRTETSLGSSSLTTAARDLSPNFHQVHKQCTETWASNHRESVFDFQAFEMNRQMYQEAFALFWGTSRFSFEEGVVLKRFGEALNGAQKNSLKYIMLDVFFVSQSLQEENWDTTYWGFRREWPVCHLNNASLHPLRSMESLELHLELGYVERDHSHLFQIGTTMAVFRAMANWRLLRLRHACVTISYSERVKRYATNGQLIEKEELVDLAQSFQKTLLDPTVTEEDQARFLTYEIQDLEQFLVEERESNKSYSQIVRSLQIMVRRGQVITEDVEGRLTNMRATLERKNRDEMHNLLMAQGQRPRIARI